MFWSIEGNRTLMFPGSKHDRVEITVTPEGRSILSISKIQRTDAGKIIVCSAVNSVGSISSRVVLTLNTQEERPPPIIVQGPTNQTLPIKSMATLLCKTMGNPIPVVSWYKDGIPIVQSTRVNVSFSGTLTITDLNKDEDAGLYTCVASSRSGKSTWSAFLKVEMPTNPNIKFYRAPEPSSFPGQPGNYLICSNAFVITEIYIVWPRARECGGLLFRKTVRSPVVIYNTTLSSPKFRKYVMANSIFRIFRENTKTRVQSSILIPPTPRNHRKVPAAINPQQEIKQMLFR